MFLSTFTYSGEIGWSVVNSEVTVKRTCMSNELFFFSFFFCGGRRFRSSSLFRRDHGHKKMLFYNTVSCVKIQQLFIKMICIKLLILYIFFFSDLSRGRGLTYILFTPSKGDIPKYYFKNFFLIQSVDR